MSAPTIDDVVSDALSVHPQPDSRAPSVVADVMRDDDNNNGVTGRPAVDGAASQTTDRTGATHDPAQHECPPRITARGTWAKRRGRLSLDEAFGVDGDGATQGAAPQAPPAVDSRAIARNWCDRVFMFAPITLGPAWEPSPKERESIEAALEVWMRDSGWNVDLPPGWALVMAVAVYALPRLMTMPWAQALIAKTFGRPTEPPKEEMSIAA